MQEGDGMWMVAMGSGATREQIEEVESLLSREGELVSRVGATFLARGPASWGESLSSRPGVARTVAIATRYVLSAREAAESRTRVRIGPNLSFGGPEFPVIAGPCSVESAAQTLGIARAVRASGARALRGGAFKPRTSPFTFQGLGDEGLEILARVRSETGLPIVSEIMDASQVERFSETVDLLQVGMRNALNFTLLKALGRSPARRPVLLKCGVGESLEELLCAADYILAEGNPNVILCLRGSVGFGQESRAALNVADLPVLRSRTHLPIVVDPSHVAGDWRHVPAIAAAALVSGADGLLVEVHDAPETALSDGAQALRPERFHRMMSRLRLLAPLAGRTMVPVSDARPPGSFWEEMKLESP